LINLSLYLSQEEQASSWRPDPFADGKHVWLFWQHLGGVMVQREMEQPGLRYKVECTWEQIGSIYRIEEGKGRGKETFLDNDVV
jgi:hypothetical protein